MAAGQSRPRRHGTRRARSIEARADDDDDCGHGAEGRPRVPRDLGTVPRRSGRARRRFRAGMVQADATAIWGRRSATSGPKFRRRDADLAWTLFPKVWYASVGCGCLGVQVGSSGERAFACRSSSRRHGLRPRPIRKLGPSWWCEWSTHRAQHRRRTGRSTSLPNSPRLSSPSSTNCVAVRCPWPMPLCLAGSAAIEKAAKDAGYDRDRAVHRRSRRRDAGLDRRRKLRLDGAAGRCASATI